MFCPECGSSDKEMIGNICIDCFLKDYQFLKIPENIKITVCKHCNAKYYQGKWIDEDIPEEEIIYRTLEDNIEIDDMIEDEIIDLEIVQMRGTIAECTIDAIGEFKGRELREHYNTNVQIKNSTCPTCSKRNSGYYEIVIQLRADERELKPEEIQKADEIIYNVLNKQFKKDKLAYLHERAVLKEGIDYYIGSYKSGKKVLNGLKNHFGGTSKESPRLISEDKSTGKRLYRIWVSLRLPKFQIGDIIEFEDKIGQIIDFNADKTLASNNKTCEKFSFSWAKNDNVRIIEKKEDIQKTSVISKSPSNLEILNPDDYSAYDIDMLEEYRDFNIGDEIEVVKVDEIFYPLLTIKKKLN